MKDSYKAWQKKTQQIVEVIKLSQGKDEKEDFMRQNGQASKLFIWCLH